MDSKLICYHTTKIFSVIKNMKYSIVIPTRNRLNLLREAIETVRLQSYSNWELVVFDNASEDGHLIENYIEELKDIRIKYFSSKKFLSVTDSWNNAINKAEGDYITLIGDDDGLCPNYFDSINAILVDMRFPELIYNPFYQFWHPGVAPWEPRGHLIEIKHGFFFNNRSKPFFLSRNDSIRAIKDSLNFNISYSFNSQACVYKRTLFNRIKEGNVFYQSPYPDFYIANVALYMSQSTAVITDPIVIAGVSKYSVGYTIYNDKDSIGEAILNNDLFSDPVFQRNKKQILPGPAYNTNYFIAMKYVEKKLINFNYEFNVEKYRKIQIYEGITRILNGEQVADWWPNMRFMMTFLERYWCALIYRLRDPNYYKFWGKEKILSLLKKKINTSGCDPNVKYCGFFETTKVSDIYKYLNETK